MFVCHSGLPAAALGGDVATTERLLRSWCRTRYWRNGKRYNLIHDVRGANNVPNKAEILRLLEKYQNTTELAISTLAGSTKRIGAVMQKGVTPHVPFLSVHVFNDRTNTDVLQWSFKMGILIHDFLRRWS